MLAVEEPELTVHPGVISSVAETLKEASKRSQVIITTHSPDLMNTLSDDNILVVQLNAGITKIAPINNKQREIVRRRLYGIGDLVRMEGLSLSDVTG